MSVGRGRISGRGDAAAARCNRPVGRSAGRSARLYASDKRAAGAWKRRARCGVNTTLRASPSFSRPPPPPTIYRRLRRPCADRQFTICIRPAVAAGRRRYTISPSFRCSFPLR